MTLAASLLARRDIDRTEGKGSIARGNAKDPSKYTRGIDLRRPMPQINGNINAPVSCFEASKTTEVTSVSASRVSSCMGTNKGSNDVGPGSTLRDFKKFFGKVALARQADRGTLCGGVQVEHIPSPVLITLRLVQCVPDLIQAKKQQEKPCTPAGQGL